MLPKRVISRRDLGEMHLTAGTGNLLHAKDLYFGKSGDLWDCGLTRRSGLLAGSPEGGLCFCFWPQSLLLVPLRWPLSLTLATRGLACFYQNWGIPLYTPSPEVTSEAQAWNRSHSKERFRAPPLQSSPGASSSFVLVISFCSLREQTRDLKGMQL